MSFFAHFRSHKVIYVLLSSIVLRSVTALDVKCDQRFPSLCFIGTAIDLLLGEELILSPVEHELLVSRFEIAPVSNLKSFPSRIFQTFPRLESVTLNSANIFNISPASFLNASNLRDLHLKLNKIAVIENELFRNAPQLEHLDLSGNEISDIEDGGFSGLSKLRTIKLNDNRLKILRDRTFAGAPSIEYLHLYSNQIETIEANALTLPELTEAFLGHNKLRSLDDLLLHGTPKLELIDLSDNQLSDIGNVFADCHKMYWLNLDNNNLGSIDLAKFASLQALSSLSLNNTSFKFATAALPSAPIIVNATAANSSLESLNLANNNLSDPDIFARLTIFSDLQRLYLYNNEFTYFESPNAVKRLLPKLNTLDLTGNKRISPWLRDNIDTLKRDHINVLNSK